MVSESDFVTIPYNPDLTLAGIKYTCRSLTDKREYLGYSEINKARETIAKNGVKLGFKRFLDKKNIPYKMIQSMPFSDPDHYDIFIGGHRCEIHVILIKDKKRIRSIRAEPHLLLKTHALIPVDQLSGGELFDEDIHIITFLTALITSSRHTIEKASTAGQSVYMINMLPRNWAIPVRWNSLGTITVESSQGTTIELEFGGCNTNRKFQAERFCLKPYTQKNLIQNFYALNYIHTPNLPNDTIRVNSSFLKETYLVEPYAWSNLWIYGMDIIIGGYISRAECQKNAGGILRSGPNIQSSYSTKGILTLSIQSLHPINGLIERAKSWSQL